MVKYKVNLNFKENGKSLNEIITNILKIEIEKQINTTGNVLNKELPLKSIHYSQSERSID